MSCTKERKKEKKRKIYPVCYEQLPDTDTVPWLHEAFMCCSANTLSVISFASSNKKKKVYLLSNWVEEG